MAGVTVVLEDGRKFENVDVRNPKPADFVALEDRFNISSELVGEPGARAAWTMFIIWRICRRRDPSIMQTSFEDFVELVDDLIRDEAEADAVDPTEAVPLIE